jgi:transcriptional regulator of nitric oxide reductase
MKRVLFAFGLLTVRVVSPVIAAAPTDTVFVANYTHHAKMHVFSRYFEPAKSWDVQILDGRCKRRTAAVSVFIENASKRVMTAPIRGRPHQDAFNRQLRVQGRRLRLDVQSGCGFWLVRADRVRPLRH